MTTEDARSTSTRDVLLDAATACLGEAGYAQLSLRTVAQRAGTPVSQIHYHFGGKEGLVLAVLEHHNRKVLHRQRSMYGAEMPLWKRWQQACDYLEEDLASGYVRVLQELIAVGWSDQTVAAGVREQLSAWVVLLTQVADEAVATAPIPGLEPRQIALLTGCAFLGAEQLELLGMGRDEDVLGALRAVGELIQIAEEGA